jgi:hypothetical protein
MDTAIAEVRHHQERYWSNVPELNYERFVFRGLTASFSDSGMRDATALPLSDPIYAPDDYAPSADLERYAILRSKTFGESLPYIETCTAILAKGFHKRLSTMSDCRDHMRCLLAQFS